MLRKETVCVFNYAGLGTLRCLDNLVRFDVARDYARDATYFSIGLLNQAIQFPVVNDYATQSIEWLAEKYLAPAALGMRNELSGDH